jgi:succinate dehydrogenase / fumarate reductase cytochrome b subunit
MPRSHEQRPAFFNPARIQLPVGAVTSITHRITGVLLALSIPSCVYLLDLSLQGPSGYSRVIALLDYLPIKGAVIVSTWALAHHLLAGIRHLLSDIDIGSQLPASRRSAWIANIGGVAVALLVTGALL